MAIDLGGLLKGALGQAEAAALPGLLSAILSKTDLGSLSGVVAKLQEGGLGAQVQSWLGNGSNLPVSPDQLRGALDNEQIQQIARQLGLPVDAAMKVLAQHLPTAVDRASPDGVIPEEANTTEESNTPEESNTDQSGGDSGSLAKQAGIDDI